MLLLAAFLAFVQDPALPSLPDLLDRLAEEAEILQQNAPKSLTRETLEQRALMPGTSRFRPRIGNNAGNATPPPPRLVVRQIVSEYSVGPLKDAAKTTLTELRQVISVDGRNVQSPERARHSLSLGVASPDDRVRKRMLEDFARHGLVDIATDYGIILLAFSKRGLEKMRVTLAGEEQIASDAVWVLAFEQTTSDGGMLQFVGNQASRSALQGRILVRKSDSLPLRVQVSTKPPEESANDMFKRLSGNAAPRTGVTRDDATIDYVRSAHGYLTPVSVIHRHLVDGQLITENHYRYEPFKRFSANADIKFTELPVPDPTKK